MRYILGLIAVCLLITGCKTVAERVAQALPQPVLDLKLKNDRLEGQLAAAHDTVLTAAASAAESKLAAIAANARLSDAQKAAAAAHVEADKATVLAIQATADAKAARARAKVLDEDARADTVRRNVASAVAICHWIAGICGIIALLFALSAVASLFIKQIPLPTNLLWSLAAAGGGAVVACEIIAFLAPFYWYFLLGLPVAGLVLYITTHRKVLVTAEAEGNAADAATVQLGQLVRTKVGDPSFGHIVGEVHKGMGRFGGFFKGLIDKMWQ